MKNRVYEALENMPVMRQITLDFGASEPFKDLTIGVCLHLTKETAVLIGALLDGGAKVVACASNPLSTQDDVVEHLRERGVIVYGKKGMTDTEYEDGLHWVVSAKPDYVIDDGADLTALCHKIGIFPKGGLEETTTGINRIKNMDLKYPIIAVNDADTKHLFDNVYGTGQSTLDGIIRATNTMLAGKTFVVAGYGNCGKGLSMRARGMGCNVIVTEIDSIKALQANMDGFRVMPMQEAAKEGDIFVTVTGSKNVINASHMVCMKDGVILANSGHFDVEINVKEAKSSSWIKLLAEGRLVNLACAEGHPSEVMDMSFANQALGLEYMVKNPDLFDLPRVYDIPKEIDKKVADLKLAALGIDIDIETEEQVNYRKS